jgi:hypothetical protein
MASCLAATTPPSVHLIRQTLPTIHLRLHLVSNMASPLPTLPVHMLHSILRLGRLKYAGNKYAPRKHAITVVHGSKNATKHNLANSAEKTASTASTKMCLHQSMLLHYARLVASTNKP